MMKYTLIDFDRVDRMHIRATFAFKRRSWLDYLLFREGSTSFLRAEQKGGLGTAWRDVDSGEFLTQSVNVELDLHVAGAEFGAALDQRLPRKVPEKAMMN